MPNDELSPEDNDLAAKIRQIEAETRDDNIRKEKILALLKPRLGGNEPEKLVHVCNLPNKDTGSEGHTYYFFEAGTPSNVTLPDQRVLPPHLAAIFTGSLVEPCLQHTIEFYIGVTGAFVSQEKTVPYELLPSPAKNQQQLERLVTAATEDYSIVSKEIQMPQYMKESGRKITAVLFKNTELYQSEQARQQTVQLLQQIDDAITLQAEGKVGEEDVRTLIAKLREKPGATPQELPLEQKIGEAYLAERLVIASGLKNAEEINFVLRQFKLPYEVVLDAPAGFGQFRFTQPGYSDNARIDEATNNILWLDNFLTIFKGLKIKEAQQQAIQYVYEHFGRPQQQQ